MRVITIGLDEPDLLKVRTGLQFKADCFGNLSRLDEQTRSAQQIVEYCRKGAPLNRDILAMLKASANLQELGKVVKGERLQVICASIKMPRTNETWAGKEQVYGHFIVRSGSK